MVSLQQNWSHAGVSCHPLMFTWIVKSSAEQEAFWYGTSNMPTIRVAIMRIGTFMIPALIVFGIVCLGMGLKNTGTTTVEKETAFKLTPKPTQETLTPRNENIAKEVVMAPCEYCRISIPEISVFCPNRGIKREDKTQGIHLERAKKMEI